MNLGYSIYYGIESNEYLNELYEAILYNHSLSIFELSNLPRKHINVNDALQFADILSKSNHPNPKVAERHKVWGQEIAALLYEFDLQNHENERNPAIRRYLAAVLSSTGNFRGIDIKNLGDVDESILDGSYRAFSKDLVRVPFRAPLKTNKAKLEPEKFFFRSQFQAYERFELPYFSFSGPTSMGKSLIIQSFIKHQVQSGRSANFAVVVPTKALINENYDNFVDDLEKTLVEKNYRIIVSSGALQLESPHNFIFVLTPERLLYLLIRKKEIDIDYIFIDEAHKISSTKDSRSAFYYKNIAMLLDRPKKPHIIFASPNIPNPQVYLGLVPDAQKTTHVLSSAYSPVSQFKYLLDFIGKDFRVFNEHAQKFYPLDATRFGTFFGTLRNFYAKKSSSIVYINNRDESMKTAQAFAKTLPPVLDPITGTPDKELLALANEIKSNIHDEYFLAEVIPKGVAFHIGHLPPSIRMRIEKLYKAQKIRVIFCTSTLLEGVNLPADNLFITTYRRGKGNSRLSAVDFRNLVGRVGRIQFNLFGNVFLIRYDNPKLKMDEYVKLLQEDVPEQRLSIVNDLTKSNKELIVQCLCNGTIEIPHEGLSGTEYPIVRKFAQILLRDILKDWNSVVRREFDPFLTPQKIAKIKAAFAKSENQPDDDINNSLDQTNRLTHSIRNEGLEYPPIYINNETGNYYADYDEVLAFLKKLHYVFNWEKYEKETVGNLNSITWYATILCQWVSGYGLKALTGAAIKNAKKRMYTDNPKKFKTYVDNFQTEIPYDDSPLHRNLVINETLHAIEQTILFTFSNHFVKFTECYERIKGKKVPYDWYEYVEYGTANPVSIMFQRSGLTREASLYIKENCADYVVRKDGSAKLRRSLAINCQDETVRKAIEKLIYNAPELFID